MFFDARLIFFSLLSFIDGFIEALRTLLVEVYLHARNGIG
jgi:hypothetical protein